MGSWRFRWAQWWWDLRASMLVVPATITAAMGLSAVVLEQLELALGLRVDWLAVEPATAQVVLATLAGAMMTVVSVVYSVLLVALSLASVQFSTRIVSSMVRDPVSQAVLGLFLGTFVWLLVALRSIDLEPAFVPPLTVSIALALAVGSLGALVTFIDRVVNGIQANTLVDRIATETESVIDECFPPAGLGTPDGHHLARAGGCSGAHPLHPERVRPARVAGVGRRGGGRGGDGDPAPADGRVRARGGRAVGGVSARPGHAGGLPGAAGSGGPGARADDAGGRRVGGCARSSTSGSRRSHRPSTTRRRARRASTTSRGC
jgi:hypothetical protein